MKNKNNWYAISGVACSGKTTIIKLLEQRGYKVVHESATEVIRLEQTKGKTLEEIRRDEASFQRLILDMKLFYESRLDPKDTVFLDRGIPDSVAFYKHLKIPLDEHLMKAVRTASYKKVFLFDPLPLVRENLRLESEDDLRRMHQYNTETYLALGFCTIRVPVMPIEERLQFILENL
jgi:predicted ATPase